LHYDEYLARGLPIATGVIEGASRYLDKDRLDVPGARWSLKAAETVLKIRSLYSSGDWEEYWLFHERSRSDFERNHQIHYARPETLEQVKLRLINAMSSKRAAPKMDLLDQGEDARSCRSEIVRGVFLNSWVTKGSDGGGRSCAGATAPLGRSRDFRVRGRYSDNTDLDLTTTAQIMVDVILSAIRSSSQDLESHFRKTGLI
jgi:hypothetical protein